MPSPKLAGCRRRRNALRKSSAALARSARFEDVCSLRRVVESLGREISASVEQFHQGESAGQPGISKEAIARTLGCARKFFGGVLDSAGARQEIAGKRAKWSTRRAKAWCCATTRPSRRRKSSAPSATRGIEGPAAERRAGVAARRQSSRAENCHPAAARSRAGQARRRSGLSSRRAGRHARPHRRAKGEDARNSTSAPSKISSASPASTPSRCWSTWTASG